MTAEPPPPVTAAKVAERNEARPQLFDDLPHDEDGGDRDRDRWLHENVPPHHR